MQGLITGIIVLFQVAHFKEYIPQAFVGGDSMILDAEVLLIDTNTSKPLPFGTLGVHKVAQLRTTAMLYSGLQKYSTPLKVLQNISIYTYFHN